jgi:hypothetical protein
MSIPAMALRPQKAAQPRPAMQSERRKNQATDRKPRSNAFTQSKAFARLQPDRSLKPYGQPHIP